MTDHNSTAYFLRGGGEMGNLIRAKDWSNTSLGAPESWPQSLQTMVAMMLDNPFGMYIAWGNDFIQLYNDGYRPILGESKHPHALGAGTKETFAEIWDIIGPMFEDVMQGKPVGFPDFMLPLHRNGFVEECYFDFSYSPIRKEDGAVGGVLVTVIETTNKKLAEDNLKISEERFRLLADNIPNLAWMAEPGGSIYWYNKKWYEYTGTTLEEMEGWGWQSVHDPEQLSTVLDEYRSSLANGEPFEMVFPLKGSDGKFRPFLTRTSPVKNSEGNITHWFGSNTDVTEQKNIEQALIESQRRFHSTVKQAPVGISILRGKSFMVEMANDAYLKLVDKKEADFVGKPLFESLPEVEETVHALLDDVLDTGNPFHGLDYPVPVDRYGNFEIGYFDFLFHPLKEDDGTISGIIITVTDVSESVRTRHFIAESEIKFRKMVMESPIPMSIFRGKDFVIEMANEAMIKNIWRRREQDVLGKPLLQAFPELEEQKYTELLDDVYDNAKTHQDIESIAYIQGDDGLRKFYFDYEYSPLLGPDGLVSGIMVTVNDVSEKVAARMKIEESEQKFRLLADSMPQHIWTSDTEGNLNYFNDSVFNYSGLSLEQIQKDGWLQIVHPDDREENILAWTNSIGTGQDFLCEHRFKRHDGVYRWQLSRAIPHKDDQGVIQMWVGTSTDIEDQKTFANELESQVAQRTSEIGQKNIELEKMNKELQSFAYISSHDLQEPLRKIQTFSSQILEKEHENLSDSGQEKFRRMQNAAQRMQILIEDLLSYSRTSTAERKFYLTDLNKIVQEVKEDIFEELLQKQGVLEVASMCELAVIPFQFRQLLYNLIGNSLKFSREAVQPHIKIASQLGQGKEFHNQKLANEKNYCHISVSDNGIGFEQEYGEKIFELFQRLHGRSEYNGTGIGLAIVKKIVENHGGIITATGQPDKGAVFDIYIPVAR